jgi:hypothetical protein
MNAVAAVVRFDPALPEAEVQALATELGETGAAIAIEPASGRAGPAEVITTLTVEVGTDVTSALVAQGVVTLVAAIVRFLRRLRGARAELPVLLPGHVTLLMPADADEGVVQAAIGAAARARTDGTLTHGVWRWDTAGERLVSVTFDDRQ